MTPYTRNMVQEATYWAPMDLDGFGSREFAAPVLIKCRWEDKVNLVRNLDGREVTTQHVVYVDRVVLPRGYLCLGNEAYVDDPTSLDGAHEIENVESIPSLRASLQITKALV